ncbi:hypothetical protein K435DRAFT_646074 [Dendrothele bispora CBS 962.96]|uniref:Ima1 N-terminal domain-containing protein n=1 Tax=Dendrothele bispora (strain CBS 962.96) TaxID=1314807 RepID=A0A4S8MS89_DENBC|nr:hypothetical protein K435DRAFT_646074 [Dendrothele bispora CBS 962.96]
MFRPHSPSTVQCFFCNSSIHNPRDPHNFRCHHCGCWNRYDETGEISSYEPAMSDESLNARSFSKRASPSKNRLPTAYGKGPFCHTCQTNQMLLMNLLSNYLPPPSSLEYERRLEMLPEYRESLHLRYPPVCDSCMPAVEEEIRKKDNMARSQALGGLLKETKGKVTQRRVSQTSEQRERVSKELVVWRVRGCLWGLTLLVAMLGNLTVALDKSIFGRFVILQPVLPLLVLVSTLWTAWDPTYASVRKSRIQGRDVRYLQMTAWLSRLVSSCLFSLQWFRPHLDFLHLSQSTLRTRLYFSTTFVLELFILVYSLSTVRVQQPPTIRLIDSNTLSSRSNTPLPDQSNSRSRTGTPAPAKLPEPDLFASLSLSNKPVVASKTPVFGMPSLLSNASVQIDNEEPSSSRNDDEMDWTPTSDNVNTAFPIPLNTKQQGKSVDDGSWLRPQRFFAPEKPTGLETLFEKTKLADDVTMSDTSSSAGQGRIWLVVMTHLEKWWWLYAASVILCCGVGLRVWLGQHFSNRGPMLLAVEDSIPPIVDEPDILRHIQRPVEQDVI